MRKIILNLITFIFLYSSFSSLCHSMEDNNLGALPETYTHVKIQNQIEEYRTIYDDILLNNPENPYQSHSSHLFKKLQNAFILTRDYIRNAEVLDPDQTKRDQKLFLDYLNTLYKAAIEINASQNMSPLHFERINILCALIGKQYRRYQGSGTPFYLEQTWLLWEGRVFDSSEKEKGMAEESLKNGVEATVNFIKQGMNKTFIGDFDANARLHKDKFLPIAVIYMNKNIPIGYKTFVNQSFSKPYPMSLATFFPTPVPTCTRDAPNSDFKKYQQTKNEAHFSAVRSLFTMLAHDFEHRSALIDLWVYYLQHQGLSWKEYLRVIYDAKNDMTAPEQKVLEAGLFMLVHELQLSHIIKAHELLQPFTLNPTANMPVLKNAIESFQDYISRYLNNRGSEKYKTDSRDEEYVLIYSKNIRETPFLPVIQINNEEKFLPVAKDNNGRIAIILKTAADSSFMKVRFIDQEQIIEIANRTDENNNFILPQGWQWLSKLERKQLPLPNYLEPEEVLKYNAREDLYKLRHSYAKDYIKTGYEAFWEYFRSLALQAYKNQKTY